MNLDIRIGDLVRLTRAGIGVPRDSIALVTSISVNRSNSALNTYWVQLCNGTNRTIRRLKQDLEVC